MVEFPGQAMTRRYSGCGAGVNAPGPAAEGSECPTSVLSRAVHPSSDTCSSPVRAFHLMRGTAGGFAVGGRLTTELPTTLAMLKLTAFLCPSRFDLPDGLHSMN